MTTAQELCLTIMQQLYPLASQHEPPRRTYSSALYEPPERADEPYLDYADLTPYSRN